MNQDSFCSFEKAPNPIAAEADQRRLRLLPMSQAGPAEYCR